MIERDPVLRELTLPLELLARDTSRSYSRLARPHTISLGLQGDLLRLSPHVLCVPPGHVAIQMSPSLTNLELLCLLSELLGLYAIAPSDPRGMFQRHVALVTPDGMRSHLDALRGHPGVGRTRWALSHACVGSGSPRETKLALRMGLRPGLGGWNLPILSMNDPVEVRRIHDSMSRGVRKPDILLLAPPGQGVGHTKMSFRGLAFEYNGSDHFGERRHAEDVMRHNELAAMGFKEYVIDKNQYRDLPYMDGLMSQARLDLGLPRIGLSRAEAEHRRGLRQRLFERLERIDGIEWGERRGPQVGATQEDSGEQWWPLEKPCSFEKYLTMFKHRPLC